MADVRPPHIGPADIAARATGYWQSQALCTAVQLGLFDAVAAGATRATLPTTMNVPARGALGLLDAMITAGLVLENAAGLLTLPPGVASLLTRTPGSMAGSLAYNLQLYELWGHLGRATQTGQPVAPPAHLGADPAATRAFVMGMHARASLTIAALARLDLSASTHLLDLASGPGTVGRHLAQRLPHLRVTLADLPAVTAIAAELTASHPAINRVHHISLDYRTGLLPSPPAPFDTILWCGALHQHPPEETLGLLRRLRDEAPAARRLITVDYLIDPASPTHPASDFAALFGLNMSLVSGTSHMYRTDEYAALLTKAGWHPLPHQTAPGHYRIIEATR